jgi:D-xylose transport system permease protein
MLEIRRKRRGVHHRGNAEPAGLAGWRVATAAVVSAVLVLALNRERGPHPEIVSLRGVPVVVPLIAALVVAWAFVLRRTAFGRRLTHPLSDHDPGATQVAAFAICSAMAAIGGVIAVSRSYSATSDIGGLSVLLSAVAAALLGATGPFGGVPRPQGALLGAAVVTVVDSGLGLMSVGTGVRYVVICLLVLIALAVRVPSAGTVPARSGTAPIRR